MSARWKEVERAVAAKLGGQRVPITGRQRGDAPDVQHPWLSIEVKHRKLLPGWLHEIGTELRYIDYQGGFPAIIMRDDSQSFVVMRLAHFIEYFVGSSHEDMA